MCTCMHRLHTSWLHPKAVTSLRLVNFIPIGGGAITGWLYCATASCCGSGWLSGWSIEPVLVPAVSVGVNNQCGWSSAFTNQHYNTGTIKICLLATGYFSAIAMARAGLHPPAGLSTAFTSLRHVGEPKTPTFLSHANSTSVKPWSASWAPLCMACSFSGDRPSSMPSW